MGLFKRRSSSSVDTSAEKAYKRGDTVHVRTIHAAPGKNDGGLGLQIARIEAAGWKLEQQNEGSKTQLGYEQRYWTLTFRAVPSSPSAT